LREAWVQRQFAGATATSSPIGFGSARPPVRLVVDLGENLFSRRWWQGVATLAALIVGTAMLAPAFEPLPSAPGPSRSTSVHEQWQAAGVGSRAQGSRSGIRMAAGANVAPIAQAPERAFIQAFVTVGSDGLARSLARLGASNGDAVQVDLLVRGAGGRIAPGTGVSAVLGRKGAGGRRPVEKVDLRTALDMRMRIERGAAGLVLTRQPIAVDRTPIRVRGRAGEGLYWALRAAGASSQSAASYLKALATQIDVGEFAPDDRFDLILANQRSAAGESRPGPLLYAGLERSGARSLQLIAWNVGGRVAWIDAAAAGQLRAANAMMWPVKARITSTFGRRVHPILRLSRMHKGVDFGAGWGTPIHAAADGQVTRAGWAGGYGRQVSIDHGGGLATSYSHMSRMAVEPGALIRQGQVIGHVGSSGLSTGPHLHYEVLRDGQAVNPMSVRFAAAPAFDAMMTNAVKARLRELLGVGER
jgi:murein DD-endopeptidase MepM/ murein hydrolase activator NlpD